MGKSAGEGTEFMQPFSIVLYSTIQQPDWTGFVCWFHRSRGVTSPKQRLARGIASWECFLCTLWCSFRSTFTTVIQAIVSPRHFGDLSVLQTIKASNSNAEDRVSVIFIQTL